MTVSVNIPLARGRSVWATAWLLALSLLATDGRGTAAPPPPAGPPILTTVAQVRALSTEQARRKYPIRLRGVITYHSPEYRVTFFQDETAGIFVWVENADSEITTGSLVEVAGNSTAGDFAPSIEDAKIRVRGHGRLPGPSLKTPPELMTGSEDSQWVEVKGVVHSVRIETQLPPDMRAGPPQLVLGIGSGRNSINARVRDFDAAADYRSLVDAVVSVRGACGTLFNRRRQLVGVQLFVPTMEQMRIEAAGSADPYQLPILPINSLLQFTPAAAAGRRIHVRGAVTLVRSGQWIFVQDASGGAVVKTSSRSEVNRGDVVDATGFPTPGMYAPILSDGDFRKLGSGDLPAPVDMTNVTSLSADHDAELVTIQGYLVDQSRQGPEHVLTLQLGDSIVVGQIEERQLTDRVRSFGKGSLLQLTGVWSPEMDENRKPLSYRVLLDSADSIVLVRSAAFWTGRRVVGILGVFGGVILLGAVWVTILRRRVREQTETMRAALESTADGILAVNPEGAVVTYNQKFAEMWGVPAALLELRDGNLIFERLSKRLQDPRQFTERTKELREDCDTKSDEILHCMDGKIIEQHSEPQRINGKGVGRVWGFRDVTEQRRGQEAIERARDAAELANRTKSEFLANMSHEIRTPMNGVIGMTEIALDTDLTEEQRDCLNTVRTSSESLLSVINDILDFSKIEAGKLTLEAAEFDLDELLQDVIRVVAVPADRKGLELLYESQVELPTSLRGDAGRLRQVVVNLVGNAVKFTEEGEIALRVVDLTPRGQTVTVHFSVSDTGIGISGDWKDRVFEAFVQADGSSTRLHGGTGLGLAISSRLVSLMDGRIWVQSEPGKGSTFHFTAEFGVPACAHGDARTVLPEALRGLSVLVVDDNSTNRRILFQMLRRWHMRPVLAESGRVALDTLRRHAEIGDRFGLILLDAHMPEMDGFAVARKIRDDPSLEGPRIMMLSSLDGGMMGPELREIVTHRLVKPVTRANLLKAILKVFEQPRGEIIKVDSPPVEGAETHVRILLVEDNPINQKVAVQLLRKLGYRSVVTAINGLEALEAFVPAAFDLILMDVQMPIMDGYDSARAIRLRELGTGTHVPIVALTAHALKGDREKCMESGMNDYLRKPIHLPELKAVVERWTESDERLDALRAGDAELLIVPCQPG